MKSVLHYLSLIFLVLLASVSYSDSIEEAYDVIRNGNTEAGYKMLLPFAEKDDSRACYGIALLLDPLRYKEDWGVEKNSKQAINYYQKAAELGHQRAMFDLGMFYQNGHLVEQDYVEAIKWYEMAANKGYAAAMYGLGGLYFNGLGVKKDQDIGKAWFTKAANIGFSPAIKFLDEAYNFGMSSKE